MEVPRRVLSPGAEHLVAFLGDIAPENRGLGQNAVKLNSFCYLTSSFNSSFVHTCLE